MYDLLVKPFSDFLFMRHALVACIALSLGCAVVGVLLVLRRMSLMGDALSHSVLPGVAIGYVWAGMSLLAMGIGGALAAGIVAIVATLVSRHTILREDASFVGFYLIALAAGTVILHIFGKNIDLVHIIFGNVIAASRESLYLISAVSTFTLLAISIIYRPLIIECFDPVYMRSIKAKGGIYHGIFMLLVVINMVAAFQILGTLMALGLMMIPAVIARLWGRSIAGMYVIAFFVSCISCYCGLLFSSYYKVPSGPAIILILGIFYILSIIFGRHGSILKKVMN